MSRDFFPGFPWLVWARGAERAAIRTLLLVAVQLSVRAICAEPGARNSIDIDSPDGGNPDVRELTFTRCWTGCGAVDPRISKGYVAKREEWDLPNVGPGHGV
jgi:hypothetical protein